MEEFTRLEKITEFNGIKLLDGTAGDGSGTMTFQVGTRNTANDQITIVMNDQDSAALAVDSLQVDSLSNSQDALAAIDTAAGRVALQAVAERWPGAPGALVAQHWLLHGLPGQAGAPAPAPAPAPAR